MQKLRGLNATLEEACGDPTRNKGADYKQPTRRQQLVALRDQLRTTLEVVDTKLVEAENEKIEMDPVIVQAREDARERMKLPIHLRGSAVLASTTYR